MTNEIKFGEDKPWIETVNGNLNANSNGGLAVFGLVGMAYEQLGKAPGVNINNQTIDALAGTFALMVRPVQAQFMDGSWTESDSGWGVGLNKRLRGLLHSYITVNPIPFGGNSQDWQSWMITGQKHLTAMAKASNRLFYAQPQAEPPYLSLASDAPAGN